MVIPSRVNMQAAEQGTADTNSKVKNMGNKRK